jgi:hypothetical protein
MNVHEPSPTPIKSRYTHPKAIDRGFFVIYCLPFLYFRARLSMPSLAGWLPVGGISAAMGIQRHLRWWEQWEAPVFFWAGCEWRPGLAVPSPLAALTFQPFCGSAVSGDGGRAPLSLALVLLPSHACVIS